MAVQEQFIIDAKGKKTGVILPLKRYQRLMEDLHDLASSQSAVPKSRLASKR